MTGLPRSQSSAGHGYTRTRSLEHQEKPTSRPKQSTARATRLQISSYVLYCTSQDLLPPSDFHHGKHSFRKPAARQHRVLMRATHTNTHSWSKGPLHQLTPGGVGRCLKEQSLDAVMFGYHLVGREKHLYRRCLQYSICALPFGLILEVTCKHVLICRSGPLI